MTFITKIVAQTEQLGEKLGKALLPGAVVCFSGTLGAGKTAFVRGLARGLGYPGIVNSPTFTLCNAYDCADAVLYHFDLYRLSGAQELADIGFYDYLDEKQYIAVEWSERAQELMPADAVFVDIRYCREGSPDTREISITGIDFEAEMTVK